MKSSVAVLPSVKPIRSNNGNSHPLIKRHLTNGMITPLPKKPCSLTPTVQNRLGLSSSQPIKNARLNAMRYVLSKLPYDNKDPKVVGTVDPLIVGRAGLYMKKANITNWQYQISHSITTNNCSAN